MEEEGNSQRSMHGEEAELKDDLQQFIQTLPMERAWEGSYLYLYQGFWYRSVLIRAVISFQQHFQARNGDTILASVRKSGTTWLKSLTFSILNRTRFQLKDSPLLTKGPHDLVPLIESDFYFQNQSPNLEDIDDPRIFQTHVPYNSLPPSIVVSDCKIVYLCRNPLDLIVSTWHYGQKLQPYLGDGKDGSVTIEESVEKFCQGTVYTGPFWDHVLGYWKASLERPNNILFLKYEDLKTDIILNIKRIAEFLGFGFSKEEEKKGVIEEISSLCSLQSLKDLEVNKTGRRHNGFQNSAFFRKGEVGDWVNHLTPEQAKRVEKLVEEKLHGSGLSFKGSFQSPNQ